MSKIIRVEANSPFLIKDNSKAYVVKEGTVDIFITKVSKEPIGRRCFVASIDKGGIVLGSQFKNELSNNALIVSGLFGTKIEEIDVKKITAQQVENFFSKLSSNFNSSSSNVKVFTKSFAAKAGTVFRIKDNFTATIKSGEASLVGRKLPKKFIASNSIIFANSDVTVELSKSFDTISIQESFDVYLLASLAKEEYIKINENKKFKAKLLKGREFIVNSLSNLISVFSRDRNAFIPNSEPHLAVAEIIGKNLDMRVVKPREMNEAYFLDPVNEIARVSKFMTRAINLENNWWNQDSGPIYAFIGKDPIALLPKGSGYIAVNPKTKSSVKVTKELANKINSVAYVIYKPFPNKVLGLWDIFKFVMRPNTIKDFLTISLMGGAMGVLSMFTPIVTGVIFSSVIPSAEYNSLIYIIMFLISITATISVFSITRSIASLRFEGRVDYMIQSAIWARVLSLPVPFFSKYNSSDLSTRANSIIRIRQMLTGAAMSTILSAIFSVFQFFLLFYYSLSLAIVGLLLTVVPIAVIFISGKIRLGMVKESIKLNTDSSNMIMQIINGISKFKIIGGERRAFALWSDRFNAQNHMEQKSGKIAGYSQTFNSIYPILTSIVIFYFVAKSPDISVGSYLAFQSAFGSFMGSLLGLASTAVSLLNIVPLYQRAKPILETIPEVTEQKSDPGKLHGAIKISNVSYKYNLEGPNVLENIDIDIKPGEFVAFVGGSGSGKSTLIRLLLGFDKPQEGSISYDNFNIKDVDIQALRREMGVVLQKGRLMPGDIFNNIIGPYNLTMDDAWAAAEAAGLADDIRAMPMGMHTVVGGGTLSGGQKQRVLIARSLVNKPKLIFFDSATSALDNKTQGIVIESLSKMNSTKIVVAHRLTTIVNADRIFVFEKGKIVEQGSYDDLMKQDGIFAEFARRQLA